jgi:hypothetical protein
MEFENILYTPLDVPPKPNFDLNQLKFWLNEKYKSVEYKEWLIKNGFAGEKIFKNYGWNVVVAYFNMMDAGPGWIEDFDKEFPQLSEYIYSCFGFDLDRLGSIVFLPVKKDHIGLGDWHQDRDSYALRHYFAFDYPDKNKLLLRKTKEPYNIIQNIHSNDIESYLDNSIYECDIRSSTQSYYLNNVRAAHATYTEVPNVDRIATIVSGKINSTKENFEIIKDLVLRSAEKFPESVILY